MNITYHVLHKLNAPTLLESLEITNFLHEQLGEYGDDKESIKACLDYAFNKTAGTGGFAIVAKLEDRIVGATIINTTAMKRYIPSNTLVYIATAEDLRGHGIASTLLRKVQKMCKGGIALHVEPNNPAKSLYEKLGFEHKYFEMRFEH